MPQNLEPEYLLEEPDYYEEDEEEGELVLGQDNWSSRGGHLDLYDIDDDEYDNEY